MHNVYYNPDKFGLTIVGEVEWSSGCYEFDKTVVWKDATGQIMWASDSGCSCPTPFESLGVNDLNKGSFHELAEYLAHRREDAHEEASQRGAPQVTELLGRLA